MTSDRISDAQHADLCLDQSLSSTVPSPKLIAFFLTQFHPTPENDEWWGKGFTEWTNVTKAKELFDSHYQPHLPSDLGFYDLRLRETRHEQYKLAKQYGIDGFCYYYYWFSGRRVLHGPLEEMLEDKEHNMPFCLCWANENWTRRWDAAEHEILLAQRYLPEDDLEFIKSLEPYLRDSRYIKTNGKPLILVYRPQHHPNMRKAAGVWREYCLKIGIGEIHLCAALTHGNSDYQQFGFDSGVEFPPHNLSAIWINHLVQFHEDFKGYICQYSDLADSYMSRSYDGTVYKTVFPSWDNTARRSHRALIVLNGTPANYEYWLSCTLDQVKDDPKAGEFVFINAWNEWAEGCHLEPDRQWGHSFLESTLQVKHGTRNHTEFQDVDIPQVSRPNEAPLLQEISETLRIYLKRRYQAFKVSPSRKLWLLKKTRAFLRKFHS